MSITKSRLNQIIKEEIERVTEGYGSSGWGGRGGRYEGGDTTGYKGRYGGTPWYRQGGSGRMSDAEARERGGRGYDERHEDEGPSRPRGGLVSSSVTIYTDPSMVSKAWRAALGSLGDQLDDHAKTYLGKLGYDGMVGNLIRGNDPTTGYSDVGPRWVLSKSPEGGYTFRVGTVIGGGETPSAALTDAAQQGFEGSEGVLEQLGVERDEFYAADRSEDERTPGGEQYVASMDDMDPMDEGDAVEAEQMNESARKVTHRWSKLAGLMTEGSSGRLNEFKWPWEDYEATPMTQRIESSIGGMLSDMRAAGMGKKGFNPDALQIALVGDGSSSTGVALWVWFESGNFPVVGGLVGTEADLKAAVQRHLPGGVTVVNAVKDMKDRDPDTGMGTYGWKIRLTSI